MTLLKWALVLLIACSGEFSSLHASECSAARVAVGKASYRLRLGKETAALEKNQVASTENSIKTLGFTATVANLQDWQDLGETERDRAKKDAIGGWISFTQAAGAQAIATGSLPRFTYPNKTIARLRLIGLEDEPLFNLIRDFTERRVTLHKKKRGTAS